MITANEWYKEHAAMRAAGITRDAEADAVGEKVYD